MDRLALAEGADWQSALCTHTAVEMLVGQVALSQSDDSYFQVPTPAIQVYLRSNFENDNRLPLLAGDMFDEQRWLCQDMLELASFVRAASAGNANDVVLSQVS